MDDPNKKESVADVLARMQSELSFNVQDFMEPGDVMQAARQETAPTNDAASASSEIERRAMELVEGAESAVQATDSQDPEMNHYMDTLLNRYQGDGTGLADAKSVPPTTTTPKPTAHHPAEPLSETPLQVPISEGPQLLDQNDYLPQKKAPEQQASIAAMRELAVHSARRAIQDSVQRRRGMDATLRMSLGVGCAVIAAGSFYLAEGVFTIMTMLGLAAMVGAIAFFINWKETIRSLQKP